ncbi:ATP phosphoribosyltransferase [Gottfriedia acidiceleris]|uniref:ATP phosphoribosyltransferase n=1 Tax=Gottfriedia acidiceleris TaxID=371036 RepID=UPI0030001AA9
MDWLTIAIAKGRIEKDMNKIFYEIGMGDWIDPDSRKLVFEDHTNHIKYIFVKPVDVVTYVENGVADLGVVGKDVILEQEGEVYELLDLQLGKCTFAVASFPQNRQFRLKNNIRIATKYPNITKKYFEDHEIEIIPLNGSVELAPLIGLSDVIVDLVETGNTLKANGLVVLEEMMLISAKIISNKVSYRFHYEKIMSYTKKISEGRKKLNENISNK